MRTLFFFIITLNVFFLGLSCGNSVHSVSVPDNDNSPVDNDVTGDKDTVVDDDMEAPDDFPDEQPDQQPDAEPVPFSSFIIDSAPDNPSFITAADMDGDGYPEIIVSKYGNSMPYVGGGFVDVYAMKTPGNISVWEKTRVMEKVVFPNQTTVADVNGDGIKDIIVAAGSTACYPDKCGAMSWLEHRPDSDPKWVQHDLIKDWDRFFYYAAYGDIDKDGIDDLVTGAEEKGLTNDGSSNVIVFRGIKGKDRFESQPVTIYPDALGGRPRIYDINRDGYPDIASNEYYGSKGSFAWLMNKGATGAAALVKDNWTKYYIDNQHGKAIQLSFIDNLCADGSVVAVGANHTNTSDDPNAPESAVFRYIIPTGENLEFPWPVEKISQGIVSRPSTLTAAQAAPGVFAPGDINGDGTMDIVVTGDGDPRLFILFQTAQCVFNTIAISEGFPQGGVAVADFDKDGKDEIIASSYESNRLVVFKKITDSSVYFPHMAV